MGLSCYCDWEAEPGSIGYYPADDFEIYDRWISKRCQSCNELIRYGQWSVMFSMLKVPEHEIEINIYGEDGEIPLANQYMCEKCGEMFFNLSSLGYCIMLGDDMFALLAEYQAEKRWERERLKPYE